mmetsp:Transcript_16472/g.41664  ORF Transcript_16472/g.41664 Transcript_16472/m.41664 type:complete len:319 (-) Transcript_16472:144-1100(-)
MLDHVQRDQRTRSAHPIEAVDRHTPLGRIAYIEEALDDGGGGGGDIIGKLQVDELHASPREGRGVVGRRLVEAHHGRDPALLELAHILLGLVLELCPLTPLKRIPIVWARESQELRRDLVEVEGLGIVVVGILLNIEIVSGVLPEPPQLDRALQPAQHRRGVQEEVLAAPRRIAECAEGRRLDPREGQEGLVDAHPVVDHQVGCQHQGRVGEYVGVVPAVVDDGPLLELRVLPLFAKLPDEAEDEVDRDWSPVSAVRRVTLGKVRGIVVQFPLALDLRHGVLLVGVHREVESVNQGVVHPELPLEVGLDRKPSGERMQ